MSRRREDEAGGCAIIFVIVLVIGAVVAAIASIAALVDPFSLMPSFGELWAECEDNYDTQPDDCAWDVRYPGFWGFALVNLVYAVGTTVLLYYLVTGVRELRAAREPRFSSDQAVERYRVARHGLAVVAGLLAALALVPIVVALF